MGFKLVINKQVQKKLQSLDKFTQYRIIDKINDLGHDPDDESLDVKRMVHSSHYRLRVGDWRIIFQRDNVLKIIAIEKLKPRGDVYK